MNNFTRKNQIWILCEAGKSNAKGNKLVGDNKLGKTITFIIQIDSSLKPKQEFEENE